MNRVKLKRFAAGRGTKQALIEMLSGSSASSMSASLAPASMYVFGLEGDLLSSTAQATADLTVYSEELFGRRYAEKNPDIDPASNAYDLKVSPTSAVVVDGVQFNDFVFWMTDETIDPTRCSLEADMDVPMVEWDPSRHEVVLYYPLSGVVSGESPYGTFTTMVTSTIYDTYKYAAPAFTTDAFFTKALFLNSNDPDSSLVASNGVLHLSGRQNTIDRRYQWFDQGFDPDWAHIGCTYNFIPSNIPEPLSGMSVEFEFNLDRTAMNLFHDASSEWGAAYRYIKFPAQWIPGSYSEFRFIVGNGIAELMVNNGRLGYRTNAGVFSPFPELSGMAISSGTWYSVKMTGFDYDLTEEKHFSPWGMRSFNDNFRIEVSTGDSSSTISSTGHLFVPGAYPYDTGEKKWVSEYPGVGIGFIDIRLMGDVYALAPPDITPAIPKVNPYASPSYLKLSSSQFNSQYNRNNAVRMRNFLVHTNSNTVQTTVTTTSGTSIDPEKPGQFDVDLIISRTPIYLGDYRPVVFADISGSEVSLYVQSVSSELVYERPHTSPGLPFTYLFETPLWVGPKFIETSRNLVFGELVDDLSGSPSADFAYAPVAVLSGYGTMYTPYADSGDVNKIYYSPFILKNMYDYDWQTRIDRPRELLTGIREYLKIGKTQDTIWLSYKYHTEDPSTITDYELVERVIGLYKYRPIEGHKSNIYSIRINNSGLNESISDMTDSDSGALSGFTTSGIMADLKGIIENAVHDAVKRIAPAHTQLWKIEYTGA